MKYTANYALRVILYLILVAPLLLFIAYAFSTRWFFPQPFPLEWTTVTFQRAINDARTISSMAQGIWIAMLVSVLSLMLALPAARVLGLRKFRGRQLAWLLLFLPTIIPPLAIGMGLNILFLRIGLAGTIAGVILAHIIPTLPYTIFTLSSAFARFDENYEFQALALGA
ncbi:MAG: ABC transporter permease, partial [Chloroflexi bacterium]|nr:ABC transporter permease [Chloroflexota bacterium]